MFGLFKKKEKKNLPEVEEIVLSEEEVEKLNQDIQNLTNKIALTENKELAQIYEQIGLKQAQLKEIDAAIESLEKSLAIKKSIDDGYKKLMSLYNTKRAESAKKGDDAGIDYYMGKMDEMRQIAREMVVNKK